MPSVITTSHLVINSWMVCRKMVFVEKIDAFSFGRSFGSIFNRDWIILRRRSYIAVAESTVLVKWLSLLCMNSGSAQAQILLTACRRFAMVASLTMVPAGNKAKRLSSVNHTTKTIYHYHHNHHHHHHHRQ